MTMQASRLFAKEIQTLRQEEQGIAVNLRITDGSPIAKQHHAAKKALQLAIGTPISWATLYTAGCLALQQRLIEIDAINKSLAGDYVSLGQILPLLIEDDAPAIDKDVSVIPYESAKTASKVIAKVSKKGKAVKKPTK